MASTRPILLAASLLIAPIPSGCSASPGDPDDVTADEARQLNEAAEMLDANSVSAAPSNHQDVAP